MPAYVDKVNQASLNLMQKGYEDDQWYSGIQKVVGGTGAFLTGPLTTGNMTTSLLMALGATGVMGAIGYATASSTGIMQGILHGVKGGVIGGVTTGSVAAGLYQLVYGKPPDPTDLTQLQDRANAWGMTITGIIAAAAIFLNGSMPPKSLIPDTGNSPKTASVSVTTIPKPKPAQVVPRPLTNPSGNLDASANAARNQPYGNVTVPVAPKTGVKFSNQFPTHEIGVPIQKFSPSQVSSKNFSRRLNYVVTEDGQLVLGRQARDIGGGHIDLAGGNQVLAAGEVKIVNGKIQYVDNSSGHYLPTGQSAQDAAISAFERAGLNAGSKYIEKIWNGSAWVPK